MKKNKKVFHQWFSDIKLALNEKDEFLLISGGDSK